jgi:hypothetical protein
MTMLTRLFLQLARLPIFLDINLDRPKNDPVHRNTIVLCNLDECVDQLFIDGRLINRLRCGSGFCGLGNFGDVGSQSALRGT